MSLIRHRSRYLAAAVKRKLLVHLEQAGPHGPRRKGQALLPGNLRHLGPEAVQRLVARLLGGRRGLAATGRSRSRVGTAFAARAGSPAFRSAIVRRLRTRRSAPSRRSSTPFTVSDVSGGLRQDVAAFVLEPERGEPADPGPARPPTSAGPGLRGPVRAEDVVELAAVPGILLPAASSAPV